LAGYILVGSKDQWNISFGVLTALYAVSTLLIILFGHETYYNTNSSNSRHQLHPILSKLAPFIGLPSNNHITNLPKAKRDTLISQSATLAKLIFKLPLLLPGIGVMINFCWPIGITTTIDIFLYAPPYLFDDVQASSMRFAGVIGASSGTFPPNTSKIHHTTLTDIGYIFGHFFNKWIYAYHHPHHHNPSNKNKAPETNELGRKASEISSLHFDTSVSSSWRPEYRLHGVWFPILSLAGGLVTYGLTLNYDKSWIGLAFGWILVDLGMVGSTVYVPPPPSPPCNIPQEPQRERC
jgi:hypothetical protein